MFDTLKSWLLSLTPTQLQLYTALITTLGLGIGLSTFIYNVVKDWTKIKIEIKRDNNSLLARHEPLKNYLLIQVINKGSNPVIINEVGIVHKRNYINFVDTNMLYVLPKGEEKTIMGREVIAIPGIVNPQFIGTAIISLSLLEKNYKSIKEKEKLLPQEPLSLLTRNFINAYEEVMKSYNTSTQLLTVKPYTVTTTGQRFFGKKTKIQLVNLHTAV